MTLRYMTKNSGRNYEHGVWIRQGYNVSWVPECVTFSLSGIRNIREMLGNG